MGKNSVELIIVDNIMWLNEKHIEKQLCYSALKKITALYPEYLRKERQDLIEKWFKQPCRKFLREDFGIQTVMNCRTTPAIEFKKRLGFKQHDAIMTQKESVLTKLDKFLKLKTKYFSTMS